MDLTKYLIFVKDEDKTEEVLSFQPKDSKIEITFKNSPKIYTYKLNNITVYEDPVVTDVTEETAVYHENIPLYQVRQLIDFGEKVRIRYQSGATKVFDRNSIRIESTSSRSVIATSTLAYWKDIAQYVSARDETNGIADEANKYTGSQDTFLRHQFDEMQFISPESVLGHVLNGTQKDMEASHKGDEIFPFKYNLSQREALGNAFESQISIIQGPPGTGKTQTILNILANCVAKNKTVAVVSGNNSAVENVQEKLSGAGYEFLMASLGKTEKRVKFFENQVEYKIGEWHCEDEPGVRKELTELGQRIQRLMRVEREAAKLKRELATYELERDHFEVYYEQQNTSLAGRFNFRRLGPDKILSLIADLRLSMEGKSGNGLLFRLKALFRYRLLNWNRVKSNGTDIVLELQHLYYAEKVEQVRHRIADLQKELDNASFDALLKQHQEMSRQLFEHDLYKKYSRRAMESFNIKNYKSKFSEFTRRYPIVLSTTHSLRNSIPTNYLFDYVIVDESSQVDLLSGALALSCSKNAIIVGDTKQLPQIVDHAIQEVVDTQNEFADGPYDYFRHSLLSSMIALYGDRIPQVMLREHYRCHPKIIEFCNQKYYDGQLIPFTSEEQNENPLMIYTTAEGNHMRHVAHGKKGKFNQRELDVIEKEILVSLEQATIDYRDIGVVTPYRKQVEKASGQLSQDIEIDTVHKYQGREKPTMIFSTVLDSSGSGKQGVKFVNDPHKMNVAVSRAQNRFILVTDRKLFRDHDSEIGDLIRYIEYNTLAESIVESEIVSVFDLLYQEYSDKLNQFAKRVKGHSAYESENLMSTMLGDILTETPYSQVRYREQVFVRNLFHNLSMLGEAERRYVHNGASVDILLYDAMDKSPLLAIEVDGFAFHENSPEQLRRDKMKNTIFATYDLPLLRLPTTGSGEKEKIRAALDSALLAADK